MGDLHSFEKILKRWINIIDPKIVLEWGPGRNTEIFQETDAEIISIEHNKEWYKKAQKYNSDVKQIPIKLNTDYATRPLLKDWGKFDIVFVDGRRRVECCLVAKRLLKEGGVVMLHDSNRNNYRKVIDRYIDIIEEKDDTLIFR